METRVLIIGGGATGTGLARDLALRGVECVVVEKGDINAGASGANHGLLHSGARYVADDPVSARECRDESRLLKILAAGCVEDTGGLFVAVPGDDENYIADFPGFCERSGVPARQLTVQEALDMEPELADDIIAAFRVEDASINPFKLSIDNMAHAEALGARFLGHTEVTAMERANGRIEAVRLRRKGDGSEMVIHPEQVVNACGAWAKEVAAMAGVSLLLVRSKGSLLVTQTRATEYVVNRLRRPSDADIVVPGGTVSLVGTTSIRMDHLDDVHVTFPEVDFIVSEASKMVPSLADARYIRAFAGVRALETAGQPEDDRRISRSFSLLGHERDGLTNFMTIVGGKLTTYRLMAEKAADLVCKRLGIDAPCLTRDVPLPTSEAGKWIEPRGELSAWLSRHDPDDTLLCECEMVPRSAVNQIIEDLRSHGDAPDFSAISLRSRVGKGACQGAFCAFRICGHLYREGAFRSGEGLEQVKRFLEERWAGIRPVLWGKRLVQEQLQEAIHCGLFGLEHWTGPNRNPEGNGLKSERPNKERP